MLKSIGVLCGGDYCGVIIALSGRLIGVRSSFTHRCWAHNLCVESDWPSSQTFHSSEQRSRGFSWFSPKMSMRLKVVTENKWEMRQQEGNEWKAHLTRT